jgi:hypothetical protein
MPQRSNHRSVSSAFLAACAGLACASANAQVAIVSTTGVARATAGDGSGSNQQGSTSLSGYSLSASKSFSNGNVQAQTSWGLSNWILSGSFSTSSFASSQSEAGWGETDIVVFFDADESLDIEYSGGYSVDSPSGFAEIAIRNRVTNSYVAGGQSPNLVHINPGQYKLEMNSFNPYGTVSGGFNATFRPGNDRCSFARLVTAGVHAGSTERATLDGMTTCGNSNNSRSVWYKFVANATAPLLITTCGSSYDTVLSVYDTNSCPSGTGSQIACNDDAPSGSPCGGTLSAVTINAVSGETYYIRVGGYQSSFGSYRLVIGPVNNQCEDAVAVGEGSYPFDNRFATTDGPVLNSCTNNGQDGQVSGDLWYTYTATQTGTLSVDTCGSGFDTKIAVYDGLPCDGRPVFIACNDDACGLQSRIDDLPMRAGKTYAIRVGGYQTARGTGVLNVNFTVPCPADFNGDGFLDFFDYDDFVACFEGVVCPPRTTADFNGDGFVDFFDYDDFVTGFEQGC